jgi:hypothetical protein
VFAAVVLQVRSGLAVLHIGNVSLPIALGLWLMMWPVLTKVRYELLGKFLTRRGTLKQFGVSFILNWVLGPALMTGLAWACLPDLPGFRNGVIMVGLARWVTCACKVQVRSTSGCVLVRVLVRGRACLTCLGSEWCHHGWTRKVGDACVPAVVTDL